MRAKRPASLRKLMIRDKTTAQTPDQMMAIARAWTMALGGEIKRKADMKNDG